MITDTEASMVEAHKQGREAYKAWIGITPFTPDYVAFRHDIEALRAIDTLSSAAGLDSIDERTAFRAGFLGSMRRHTQTGKVDP